MNFDLGSGERIMIRRALTLYARHFQQQQAIHKAAGDDYNVAYDKARVESIGLLSNRILRGMSGQEGATQADGSLRPLLEWAVTALDALGHDLATGSEAKAVVAKRAHSRAQQLREMLSEVA